MAAPLDGAHKMLMRRVTQAIVSQAVYNFNRSLQEKAAPATQETEIDTGDEVNPVELEEEGTPIGIANDEADIAEADAQQYELSREQATQSNVELVNEGAAQMAELTFAYMELRELYAETTEAYAKRDLKTAEGKLDEVRANSPKLKSDEYQIEKLRNGVSADEVYGRPYGAYYGQLGEGASHEQALQSANAALTRSVETDMQLAQTHAARDYMEGSKNITGWMRSPDAGACALCTEAAQGQVYRTSDLMPIHEHCGCGVTPVTTKNPTYSRITDTYHDSELGPHFDEYAAKPITEDEARGNSRPVTLQEFNQLAAEGRARLAAMKANSAPIHGLIDNLDSIKDDAWNATRESWGGTTIDSHTGEALASDADKYAITVKPPGVETVEIGDNASREVFNHAIDHAVSRFKPELQQQDHYLGVFHDDEKGTIDFDPVVVVDNTHDVETIGAYTHATGGAYHFASGDGYWPPHVVPTVTAVPDATIHQLEEEEAEEESLISKAKAHIEHGDIATAVGGGYESTPPQ